jgi:hypothetical protein
MSAVPYASLPVLAHRRAEPQIHDLARLLVEFDPTLAREVRDHTVARAEAWGPREGESQALDRIRRAGRYRELSRLIESLATNERWSST